jgi:hypothetical protein
MPRKSWLAVLFLAFLLVLFFVILRRSAPDSGSAAPVPITSPAAPPPAPSVEQTQTATANPVSLLKEILASGNDNDPRLDSEFNHLTPSAKTELIAYYESLPSGNSNERGTVVFLLGRNITEPADLVFFKRVLAEGPAQPLAPEQDGLPSEMLSVYPQLMAVRALGSAVRGAQKEPELKNAIRTELEAATQNPSEPVSRQARKALAQLGSD